MFTTIKHKVTRFILALTIAFILAGAPVVSPAFADPVPAPSIPAS